MSGNILIESDTIFFGMIKIGYEKIGIFDDKFSRSIWQVAGTIIFKGKAEIGHGSKISIHKGGQLILGNDFILSAESSIVVANKVVFGDNCLLSWDILIMDTDHHSIKNSAGDIINPSSPIIVGNKVWIGCRNLILKGSKIPDNCVIGANSVVRNNLIYENSLYAGSPIRKLKGGITWN